MRVLKKEPGRPWEAAEVDNELRALQRAVGGYLESVTLAEDVCILCDEEGRLKGKPHNTVIGGADFVGTVLLVGVAGEEFTDLTEVQEKALRETIDILEQCERPAAAGNNGVKIYLAGRISGDPGYRKKFRKAANMLAVQGYVVLNPAILPEGLERADYMRICLTMLDSADRVVFLPDYIDSDGAMVEWAYCQYTGKDWAMYQEIMGGGK